MNIFKDNQGIQHLQEFLEDEEKLGNFLAHYLKPLLHPGLHQMLKHVKSKGFNSFDIISFLSFLPLLAVGSLHGYYGRYGTDFIQCKKDVFYRFKNNSGVRWRSILYSICKRFMNLLKKRQFENASPTYLIVDDTVLGKTGKAIEFLSRVWDHVSHGYVLGYKLLLLGYYDGSSFLPLDFSLHRERGKRAKCPYGLKAKELKKQYRKHREQHALSQQRIKELDEKKSEVMLQMIKRAFKKGFKASFILADSWFFSYALLALCKQLKTKLIGMAKLGNTKFKYKNKAISAKALVKVLARNTKYNRKLKAWYIEAQVEYQGIPVKLFFVRYSQQQKWRLIVCSDTKMSFIKTMKHYQMRWSIEICFKECKQYLGLGKCQSQDFDAQIADTTLCFMLYTAIALKQRMEQYTCGIGTLFTALRDEAILNTLGQKLWKAFMNIIRCLIDLLAIDPFEQMAKMIDQSTNPKIVAILMGELNPETIHT